MEKYIFFTLLDIPSEHEDEFNLVYDSDHSLQMLQVPGVSDCTRYKLVWSDNSDMIRYLAIYHINDAKIPRSDTWKKQSTLGRWPAEIKQFITARSNGTYRQIFHTEAASFSSAPHGDATGNEYIYFLQQSVPPQIELKFNDLYNSDHIPLMMEVPGVKACSRYRLEYAVTGEIPDYLAIYAIDGAERPRSSEWRRQAGQGAWPTQIKPNFTARRNGVFERISFIKTDRHLAG